MAIVWTWIADHIVSLGGLVLQWFKGRKPAAANPTPTNSLSVAAGATVVRSPIIQGSNNTQNVTTQHVTMHVTASGEPLSIQQRKPSQPTANEIRQKQYALPPFQQGEYVKQFVGLRVKWPVRFSDIYKIPDEQLARYANELEAVSKKVGMVVSNLCAVAFTYGEENWGARIQAFMSVDEYPILRVIEKEHWAWIEGEIISVDSAFTLAKTKVEFE